MQALSLRFWSVGLVRRPWMVTAAAVVVCAGFAARAASALVAAQVPVEPPAPPPPPGPRPAQPAMHPHRDGDPLVDRNMFCSSCRPGAAPADAVRGVAAAP